MSKVDHLTPVYVEFMPDVLEEGKLYISNKYGVAIHLCPCECGHETVTPFPFYEKHGWDLQDIEGKITLSPSISNYQYPCKSHYFIRDNRIDWA